MIPGSLSAGWETSTDPRAVARLHLRLALRRQALAGSDEAFSSLVEMALDGDDDAHLAVLEVARGPLPAVYG